MKKYYVYFLLLFIISNGLLLSFGGGLGTIDSPYQIWTVEDLEEMHDSLVNAFFTPPYTPWGVGVHLRLMTDIYDTLFQDRLSHTFGGYFYGNGKKIVIKNGYIFAGISAGATIDSLIVEGTAVMGIVNTIFHSGTITSCINNATIIAHLDAYGTGSIAYSNMGTISNCINNGDITGVDNVGGIAGLNLGIITNCINIGNITATNSGSDLTGMLTYRGGVGGIVGESLNGGQISKCFNLGTVIGQRNVGGISGLFAEGNTLNCINYGFIKGDFVVGGIVGANSNLIAIPGATITNCVNVGVVEGEEDIGSIVGKE